MFSYALKQRRPKFEINNLSNCNLPHVRKSKVPTAKPKSKSKSKENAFGNSKEPTCSAGKLGNTQCTNLLSHKRIKYKNKKHFKFCQVSNGIDYKVNDQSIRQNNEDSIVEKVQPISNCMKIVKIKNGDIIGLIKIGAVGANANSTVKVAQGDKIKLNRIWLRFSNIDWYLS
ncbi:hypothetical protein DAMA08_041420 [Martiniozyma asiatica (nom. inval.)]|nr:hypothetical protein DAMA08_041420 [Martiniozyma asiatica]